MVVWNAEYHGCDGVLVVSRSSSGLVLVHFAASCLFSKTSDVVTEWFVKISAAGGRLKNVDTAGWLSPLILNRAAQDPLQTSRVYLLGGGYSVLYARRGVSRWLWVVPGNVLQRYSRDSRIKDESTMTMWRVQSQMHPLTIPAARTAPWPIVRSGERAGLLLARWWLVGFAGCHAPDFVVAFFLRGASGLRCGGEAGRCPGARRPEHRIMLGYEHTRPIEEDTPHSPYNLPARAQTKIGTLMIICGSSYALDLI